MEFLGSLCSLNSGIVRAGGQNIDAQPSPPEIPIQSDWVEAWAMGRMFKASQWIPMHSQGWEGVGPLGIHKVLARCKSAHVEIICAGFLGIGCGLRFRT